MKARRVALGLTGLLAVYMLVVGYRGVLLIADGRPAFVLLGIGVVLLPLVGVWIVMQELRFGRRVEAMGRALEASGGLPADEVLRRESGRAERASADAVFERRRVEVEAAPEDWQGWFRLALAYDDAGDRKRARGAMRTASRLHAAAGAIPS